MSKSCRIIWKLETFAPSLGYTITNKQTTHTMDRETLLQLSDLLEDFVNAAPFDMGSDEDRTLMAALDIINEQL